MSVSRTTQLPVLMYHHVSPHPGLVTCSPENFHAQMRWLAEYGWRTLSATEFLAGRESGGWPAKSVLLTFDDGYLDNRVYAWPSLQEFGFNAILFIVTGWMGEGLPRPVAGGNAPLPELFDHSACKRLASSDIAGRDRAYLRWSEIKEMGASGAFEFHSHTHSHRRFDREFTDPAAKRAALADDLFASAATLREKIGANSSLLCWPQGYHDADYREVAATTGFNLLFTTESGLVRPTTAHDALPRIVVKDKDAEWFGARLRLYATPLLGPWYARRK